MRVEPKITRYKSREDYLSKKAAGQDLGTVKDAVEKTGSAIKDKTSISKAAQEKAEVAKTASSNVSTAASSASSTTSKVTSALKNVPLRTPSLGGSDEAKEAEGAEKVDGKAPRNIPKPEPFPDNLPEIINHPGIFFITDMSLNPFRSEEGGLAKMAENIPTAKVFNWDTRDEIVNLVKKHNTNQPIILVGHGLGGDTAVEIANELNQIENGFRNVDLLVTMDSLGANNDIIPQNVTSNLNIISDGDWLFNDGPNIARNTKRTEVVNELRSESHNELDDHPDVQFQVFDKINTVLGDAVAARNIERNRIKQLFQQHGIEGVHR